jgi:hypothetical protein
MPKWELGARIGAIQKADAETVYLFGYGAYQGEEVPPDDVLGPFGRPGLFGIQNPKLLMDDGTVVWGCESWWGGEQAVAGKIGERKVVIVKPDRTQCPEDERIEAEEIMRQYRERRAAVEPAS